MDLYLGCGGGFLIAVLWMDLMFDVLALRAPAGSEVPDIDLTLMAAYYRRVTTTASPMPYLISAVMAGMVGVLLHQVFHDDARRGVAVASLALCGVPIVLALVRIFPNAIRLGSCRDSAAVQSVLARSIGRDHLLCLAAMFSFVTLRLMAAN